MSKFQGVGRNSGPLQTISFHLILVAVLNFRILRLPLNLSCLITLRRKLKGKDERFRKRFVSRLDIPEFNTRTNINHMRKELIQEIFPKNIGP
jgi:hypothetical protein